MTRMFCRRDLLRSLAAGLGALFAPWFAGPRKLWGEAQRILLPAGTPRESLLLQNPADLDTRNLEITPLEAFGTMGITDHVVDEGKWRLEVSGRVDKALSLSLPEVRALPAAERNVLLICPGVFVNHGRWKGISVEALLEKAGVKENVTHVTVRGPESSYAKTVSYPIEDVRGGKILLAYEVNGRTLPMKHGYPLRVVAEGYYGYDWVKYAYRVTAEGKNNGR